MFWCSSGVLGVLVVFWCPDADGALVLFRCLGGVLMFWWRSGGVLVKFWCSGGVLVF